MKQLVANFTGWLASLLFVVTATVLWCAALLMVFLSGNRTMPHRG
ncbi:MAG: hypothetical protein ABI318_23395 [Chthoniobacteraceae bacterium]